MKVRNTAKKLIFLLFLLVSINGFSTGLSVSEKSKSIITSDSLKGAAQKNFDLFAKRLYKTLNDSTLGYTSFRYAAKGYFNLLNRNKISRDRYFTVIDFSKPSNEERMYIIDICKHKIAYKSIVAHGKNSGSKYAKSFSNRNQSLQSSIGFYLTTSTYQSSKYKLALRLNGLEYTNSNASSRGVVMHGADYATYEFLKRNGTLGRSYGCPAMPYENFDMVVNWIKHGTCLFIYYPDQAYLNRSKILNKLDYLSYFV